MYLWQISKNFPIPKNGGHFEFSPKIQICFCLLNRERWSDFIEIFDPQGIQKIYSCQFSRKIFFSLRQSEFVEIFNPQGILQIYSCQFSKKKYSSLPKNGSHFEFSPKIPKHQFASVSLTVRDRAILSKFSTHKVSKKYTLANFQEKFSSH